jgi:hypothetical protein
MRRHNKKGNGFYKIAKATPKYVSIDAILVKVAQNYLRKIAESPDGGASDPSIPNPTNSTEGTPASPPTGTDAEPKTQTAPPPTAAESSTLYKSEGAQSARGETPATGTSPSGQPVGQPPGSVSQGTTSQPAGVSPAPGGTVSAQSGTTGTDGKTDVVEAPSGKEPPNYLKNLALLVGIPLTIASLASGAIRGFGMSSIIGLGLGAVATVYGFGFLDHLKDKFSKDIEKLERGEINTFFHQPGRASEVVHRIYNQDVPLLALPLDYSTKAENVPREFKKLYGLAHEYIMGLYEDMHRTDLRRGESKPKRLLHKIFGYEYRGAKPDEDMINSLNRGRDLERHATIIVLATMLKHIERDEGRGKAIEALRDLLERTPYWYSGWAGLEERPYLANPWTLKKLLEQSQVVPPFRVEGTLEAIRKNNLSFQLMQAARDFDVEDTREKAQPR